MKRKSKEEWRALVEDYQASGETQERWCQQNDISQATLQYHLRQAEQSDRAVEQKWVQVEQLPVGNAGIVGALTVDYGAIRITASAEYPVESLAALLLELAWAC